MPIYLPKLSHENIVFPAIHQALKDPDGLLAMGGDLSSSRIFNAYRQAIFPWFSEGEPILWWSPSERATIKANHCHISKSMKRFLRKHSYRISINTRFEQVIRACSQPRTQQQETWISEDIINAYCELHEQGHAHSIEIIDESDQLIGGLYGVNVGKIFCGESMFSLKPNTSKLAFIALNQHFKNHGGEIIDCQMMTEHLNSLGVRPILRDDFLVLLLNYRDNSVTTSCWDKQTIEIKMRVPTDEHENSFLQKNYPLK